MQELFRTCLQPDSSHSCSSLAPNMTLGTSRFQTLLHPFPPQQPRCHTVRKSGKGCPSRPPMRQARPREGKGLARVTEQVRGKVRQNLKPWKLSMESQLAGGRANNTTSLPPRLQNCPGRISRIPDSTLTVALAGSAGGPGTLLTDGQRKARPCLAHRSPGYSGLTPGKGRTPFHPPLLTLG